MLPGPFDPDRYIGGRIQRVDLATGDGHRPLHRVRRPSRSARRTTSCSTPTAASGSPTTASREERSSDRTGIYYAKADGSSITEVIFPTDAPNGIGLSPDG